MTRRIKVPKANSGFGYVLPWEDGCVGWYLPTHLSGLPRSYGVDDISDTTKKFVGARRNGERSFLCKITVTPILDACGRPITRIVKGKTDE